MKIIRKLMGTGTKACQLAALAIFLSTPVQGQTPQITEIASPGGDKQDTAEELLPTPTPYPTMDPTILLDFEPLNTASLSGILAFSAKVAGRQRIFSLDMKSQKVSVVIDAPGNNYYPSWSPDGRKICFTSDRDGDREIYSSNWDGTAQTRLTFHPGRDGNCSWAPDGSRIVYYSEDDNKSANIFSMDPDGTYQIKITRFKGRNVTPRWSPDGSLISYSTNRFWPGWDVCLWDLRTQHESCILSGRDSFCRAAWSNSGNFIVYSSGTSNQINLGLFDYSKGTLSQTSDMPGREYDAVWSPNDDYIAFAAEDAKRRGVYNVFVSDVGAGKIKPLINSIYSIRFLSWSAQSLARLKKETEDKEKKDAAAVIDGNAAQPTVTPLEMPDEYIPPYLHNKPK